MRRTATAIIAAALVAGLAACSSDPEPAPDDVDAVAEPGASRTAEEDQAVIDAVTVEGDLGAAPTVTFDLPLEVGAPVARLDVAGDGDPLEAGQLLTVHYVMIDGEDGTTFGSTWDTDTPERITMGDPQIIAALNEVLEGQNVGTRVLAAAPGGEETDTSPAFAATLMVLEIIDARAPRAEGEAVEPADGLPVVTLADDGAPSIEIPADATEPDELVVQPLIRGDGPEVTTGQYLTVHYTGWLWDGTVFDSSWESGSPFPTPIGVGAVIPGWDEGLVGQTVGSQVLLVIPSEMGYGATGAGEIPPDATLVFVVDILG